MYGWLSFLLGRLHEGERVRLWDEGRGRQSYYGLGAVERKVPAWRTWLMVFAAL